MKKLFSLLLVATGLLCSASLWAENPDVTLTKGSTQVTSGKIETVISEFNGLTETGDYVLTMPAGEYNLTTNEIVIYQDPNHVRSLTIVGEEGAIIKPVAKTIEGVTNKPIISISGESSYNGGSVSVQNLTFDMSSTSGFSSSDRVFAIYALSGGSGREDPIFPEKSDGAHR